MKKFSTVLALACLAPMLAACAPSPDKVCEHLIDVMAKEFGDDMKMSDDDKKKAQEECVKEVEEEKAKDGAKYKKQAKCVMDASTMEAIGKCDED